MNRSTRRNSLIAPLCAVMAAIALAGDADASLIPFESQGSESTEGLGAFEGTIEYVSSSSGNSQGVLTVNLTNTTPLNIGGTITGFVFNIGSSDPQASATLTDATHPFLGVSNHMAPPFGMSFDAGAALGGNWTGGGNPNPGIAVGETGTFVFDIIASDADQLTAASFFTGPYEHNFVVRHRGMNGGGSDKIPGGPGSAIPAPGALAMLLAAGVIAPRRRRGCRIPFSRCRA